MPGIITKPTHKDLVTQATVEMTKQIYIHLVGKAREIEPGPDEEDLRCMYNLALRAAKYFYLDK